MGLGWGGGLGLLGGRGARGRGGHHIKLKDSGPESLLSVFLFFDVIMTWQTKYYDTSISQEAI